MNMMERAKLLLKKVYTVSKKHDKPRLWLQSIVCETANFQPGADIYVRVEDEVIVLQNHPFEDEDDIHKIHVSSRKNRISEEMRPLVDTCGARYSTILSVQEKIEISVLKLGDFSQVIVRPLRFRLFESEILESPSDERIRLLSVCAGGGIGTSMFCSTEYYTAVQEIEIETDSAEVLKHNFKNSYLFYGDLRDCHTVAKADVAFVSLSCTESSTLGDGNEGYFENVILGTYKLLKAADIRVIFFENVPQFYNSTPYEDLKELLTPEYPFIVGPLQIDSFDFGSIAHRSRSYSLYFKEKEDFDLFRIPKAPAFRRKKLAEFLDPKSAVDSREWKSLEKWMKSFELKKEKNNSWADRNISKTFVDESSTELQCIPRRYRSHSASNSYVLSPDKKHWRYLSVDELRRIFHIPDWFSFPKHIPVYRIYEMIGQSVEGRVIKAFANEIATMFFRRHAGVGNQKQSHGMSMESSGQIGFVFA